MAKLTRNVILAMAKETTYGTPETLAGANAILLSSMTHNWLAGNTVSRDFIRPYLGNSSTIQLDQHVEFNFEVELQSSGAAGTRPVYGDLLMACGMAEDINALTDVQYTPVSTDFDSATAEVNMDGVFQQALGCRGSFNLNIARGAIPKFGFNFMGSYSAPTDDTALVPDFSDFIVPLGVNSLNTTTVTLFGEDLCMESLQIDLANNLVFRDLPGCDPEAVITNRAPSGTIVFQATDVATYNWIEAARTKTSGALQIIHGTAAGQIVQIDCPNVTLNPPTNQDSDGIWMYSFPLVLEPSSAGNDEIKITFK